VPGRARAAARGKEQAERRGVAALDGEPDGALALDLQIEADGRDRLGELLLPADRGSHALHPLLDHLLGSRGDAGDGAKHLGDHALLLGLLGLLGLGGRRLGGRRHVLDLRRRRRRRRRRLCSELAAQ